MTDSVIDASHRFREKPKPPTKPKNSERRSREYLTPAEIERVIAAARKTRHGERDAALILIAYRHGLRVSELISLRWEQVDFSTGLLHVRRRKNGTPSTHPMGGQEIRALRKLKRAGEGVFVFTTQRKGPLTASTFRKLLAAAGERAKLELPIHPHMLRHSTGYKLANDGQDTRAIQHYLGHRNIQHTVGYTELASDRFTGFWED